MKKLLSKLIVLPSIVASAIIPLSVIVSTSKAAGPDMSFRVGDAPVRKANNWSTSVNDDEKKRYVIVDNYETEAIVSASPSEFNANADPEDILITLTSDDNRYRVGSIDKVIMCGKELVLYTDYDVISSDPDVKKVKLLRTAATSKLFSLYIVPKLEPRTYGCSFSEEATNEIAQIQTFGKVSCAESFVIRVRIKKTKWIEGYIFDDDGTKEIIIVSGNKRLIKGVDFDYQINPVLQYVDIKVNQNVVEGDITVSPLFKKSTPIIIEGSYDLEIKAEGKLLEVRDECISNDVLKPEFPLSIANIDADGMRKFEVYEGSCKTTDEHFGEVTIPFEFDASSHTITLDLTDIVVAGNVSLDIDIQLRSGSSTPQDTFFYDSWKEIDMFEQFFDEDTDAFARAYQLEHLSEFVDPSFQRGMWYMYENVGSVPTPDFRVSVVSVKQMPLAADDETWTQPSDKKAYFTFMSCDKVIYDEWGHCDEAPGEYGTTYYSNPQFEKYVPSYDRNANCWYRRTKPVGNSHSSNIRNFIKDKVSKRLVPLSNKNVTDYVKHIANRTVVTSAGVKSTSDYDEAYINDTFFIPTATQVGFEKKPFSKSFPYMLESDVDGDRVFQLYQGKNFKPNEENPELVRRCPRCRYGTDWDWYPKNYWLATPASNDSGTSIEDAAVIWGDGQMEPNDTNDEYEATILCFCI